MFFHINISVKGYWHDFVSLLIKLQIMKKILGLIVFVFGISCAAMAQETQTKVKPKTTVGDKVHNVFHRRHKRHHGYKVKHKTKSAYVKPKELEMGAMG